MKFDFKIRQKRAAPGQNAVDSRENWMVLYAPGGQDKNTFPYQETLAARRGRVTREDTDAEPHVTDVPNDTGSRVSYACIKPDIGSFELLTLARKLVAAYPDSAQAHDTLAHLLWEYGAEFSPQEDPLRAL